MGSFFPSSQQARLLRERWESATMLAEELYAMMGSDAPLDNTLPIQTPATEPGAEISHTDDDRKSPKQIFKYKNNGDDIGGIYFDPTTKSIYLGDKNGAATSAPAPAKATAQTVLIPPQTVFLGQIVDGTGDEYGCWLYPKGKSAGPIQIDGGGGPRVFTVKVAEIASNQTIPAGRWFTVVLLGPATFDPGASKLVISDGVYYLQAPVFMFTG